MTAVKAPSKPATPFVLPKWARDGPSRGRHCGRCLSSLSDDARQSTLTSGTGIVAISHGYTPLCLACSHAFVAWIEAAKPSRRDTSLADVREALADVNATLAAMAD